ncbi:Type II restriction endonuclease EcoO109I [anaerobic digester metagenome]
MASDQRTPNDSVKKIAYGVLASPNALKDVSGDPAALQEFAQFVVDLWKPEPVKTEADKKKKAEVIRAFPELVHDWIREENGSKQSQLTLQQERATHVAERLAPYLTNIEQKIEGSKQRMASTWWEKANPYLTVMVEGSLKEGESFQLSAKVASSVETTWGNWIEGVFKAFNPDIKYIGAAGMDYILGNTAYDVKSGPNVMNKDQVEQARTKRERIVRATSDGILSRFVCIRDFKVAISYGNRELSEMFMRDAGDLIIYGPETWDELTGDEMNAFTLYIESIKHKVSSGAVWSAQDLEKAVFRFNQTFYNADPTKLQELKMTENFRSLSARISVGDRARQT